MPLKKSQHHIIHTNYGDYINNAACRKFIRQNKVWRQHDPIGFDLEVINRFAVNYNKHEAEINLEAEYDD